MSLQLGSLYWILSPLDVLAWMTQRLIKGNLAKTTLIINYWWRYPYSYHPPPTHLKNDPFSSRPISARIACQIVQPRQKSSLVSTYPAHQPL